MTSDLMIRASGGLNATEFAAAVDQIGAELYCHGDQGYTVFAVNTLSTFTEQALKLLQGVIFSPGLSKSDFKLIKQQYLGQLKASRSSSGFKLNQQMYSGIFGNNHPMGNISTEKGYKSVKLADTKLRYDELINSNGAIVIAIGDLVPSKMSDTLEQMFQGLKAGEAPAKTAEVTENLIPEQLVKVEKAGVTQTTVMIAKPAPGRTADGYYDRVVSNYILGGGGFESRLMLEIRNKLGNTYGIHSSIPGGENCGLYQINVTTRNDQLHETLDAIRSVTDSYCKNGPTPEELNDALQYYTGHYHLITERPSQVVSRIIAYERMGLGMNELYDYPEKVSAVNVNSATAAAYKYLTFDKMTYGLEGPKDVLSGAAAHLNI